MSELEAVQRKLEALDQEVATRARRMRILGYAILVAGNIILAWAAWFILTSPSEPTINVEYADVLSA